MTKRDPLWKAAKFGGGELEVWFVGSPAGKARLRAKLSSAGFARRDNNTFTIGVVISTIASVEEYVKKVMNGISSVTVWYRYIPVDILTLTHQIQSNGKGE